MPLGVELILPSASNRVREVVSNLLKIDDTVAFACELGALSFERETEEVSGLKEGYKLGQSFVYIFCTLSVVQISNNFSLPLLLDLPQLF